MRYQTLVLGFLIVWAGEAFAQNAVTAGMGGIASTVLLMDSDRGLSNMYGGSVIATLTESKLNRGALLRETLLETRPALSPTASGSIAAFLLDSSQTRNFLSFRQLAFPLASSNSSLKYRFTSDSLEVKYLFTRVLAVRADVGEQHAARPTWNGYMHTRTPGGPLNQTQARAGIGLSF